LEIKEADPDYTTVGTIDFNKSKYNSSIHHGFCIKDSFVHFLVNWIGNEIGLENRKTMIHEQNVLNTTLRLKL